MLSIIKYILLVILTLVYSDLYAFSFEGAGTVDDPYKIKIAADLSELADSVNSGAVCKRLYFLQTSDIDMSDPKQWKNKKSQKKLWTPIGSMKNRFQGHYDGDNKTIFNLSIDDDPDRPFVSQTGLFGCIGNRGTLKNLFLENMELHKVYSVSGGFCGMNEGVITNCHTVKSELVCYKTSGGIVGINMGRVASCTNDALLYGSVVVGGIVGYNYGEISECRNFRRISGSLGIGGICGYNGGFQKNTECRDTDKFMYSTIANCKNHEEVDGGNYTGGIVGRNDGYVYNCFNDGKILTDWYVGGIAGANGNTNDVESLIDNCVNMGDIIAREDVAAGICGLNLENGSIVGVVNSGNVMQKDLATGINIVYQNDGEIKNAFWLDNNADPYSINNGTADSISCFDNDKLMCDKSLLYSVVDTIMFNVELYSRLEITSDAKKIIVTDSFKPTVIQTDISQFIGIFNLSGHLITKFWIDKTEKKFLDLPKGVYIIKGI